jgi:hypothetical protein
MESIATKISKGMTLDKMAGLLKEKLPSFFDSEPFLPEDEFYAPYYTDQLAGLHHMAVRIFHWLKIEPNGATIDFYDEKDFPSHAGDTAGFYTTIKTENEDEKELILINNKHRGDPFAVGAILAHEMMHLYLFRLGLKLDDVRENELLTDLATIHTGLSILALNGMTYSNEWYLTLILLPLGRLYWSSKQLVFGYFKAREYAKRVLDYMREKKLDLRDVLGHINPHSRHFITHIPFIQGKRTTNIVKHLYKRKIIKNIALAFLVSAILLPLYFWGNHIDEQKNNLVLKISVCKNEIQVLENALKEEEGTLMEYEKQLAEYDSKHRTEDYNRLLTPRNDLLEKAKGDLSTYQLKFDQCNKLIDQYNHA